MEDKKISRRTILGGLAVGAGGIGAAAFAGLGRELMPTMDSASGSWWNGGSVALGTAAMAEWSQRVGASFQLEGAGASETFKLAEVRPLLSVGKRPDDVARKRGFIAVFEGERMLAGDATYTARHADGAFDIFVTAGGDDKARLLAVFN